MFNRFTVLKSLTAAMLGLACLAMVITAIPTVQASPANPLAAQAAASPANPPQAAAPGADQPQGGIPTPTSTPAGSATPTPCGGIGYRILIVLADASGPPVTLEAQLLAEPDVAAVDTFDASATTPTLAQLMPYDEIFVFSNNQYHDATALGDVVADYQDAGGVVVAGNFNWYGPPFSLAGRWMTGGYTPFNDNAPSDFSNSTLGSYNAGHPLMQGITTLSAYFRLQVSLTAGATAVATYTDGLILAAYKTNAGHTAVALNAYLGENPLQWSGQWGKLIVNAVRWLKPLVCSTPTTTPTDTPTITNTPTDTPTDTPTNTPTNTPTDTPTDTPTATPTDTPTVTNTPTDTATDTPTVTNTPTDTPTDTPTVTNTPTNTPTDTPLPPTSTPTNTVTDTPVPATNTPAPTATACAMFFPDVPPEYWAYGYIKYLYCRSIVNGYPDGYFRPDNNISRAEFSAIVTRAFGFALTTPTGGAQSFTDVPPTYWAYPYIETLAAHGVISGYNQQTCAMYGTAAPCFLPGNQITRAEMVKLVVAASDTPAYTGPLTDYPDVPPSYWAYGYIKTASYKLWVGGFADGTFRPGVPSTRAELGKVVYLAIVYPLGRQ